MKKIAILDQYLDYIGQLLVHAMPCCPVFLSLYCYVIVSFNEIIRDISLYLGYDTISIITMERQ